MSFKTVVFYGSYRSDRQGIKAARFMIYQLKQRNHEVIFVDAKEYDFPILDRMYDESGVSLGSALTKRVGQFLDELEWYEEALQRQRKEKGTPF